MNRKERRASLKGSPVRPSGARAPVGADLLAQAREHYAQGRWAAADDLCERVPARDALFVPALNLRALIAQRAGRHNLAIKLLGRALAADPHNAACHYNIAQSCQAAGRRRQAIDHFRTALSLGMSDANVEEFILQDPAIAACADGILRAWPLPAANHELFDPAGLAHLGTDDFLICALETTVIRGVPLELFLTALRAALLRMAVAAAPEFRADAPVVRLYTALAQQCFLNEYVFALSDFERAEASRLRDVLADKAADDLDIPPLLIVAVASYWPLHAICTAVPRTAEPDVVAPLLRQQIVQPLEELRERASIPALTPVDDSVSRRVQRQYEENPYPRWVDNDTAAAAAAVHSQADIDILVAGCGTGRQAIRTARHWHRGRVLAVDISRASLAYARRAARAAAVANIEFAQADILKLPALGRMFDRIDATGVLHHMADPLAAWRGLLTLLKPGGEMYVGLYSELARRPVVDARRLIAERGYAATPEGIRACRQHIIRERDDFRWSRLTHATDFYSMSGCRDLLFNVLEHRFTIAQIKAFIAETGLVFEGFDLAPEVVERFRLQFPAEADLNDLDCWEIFETANPQTFWHMYVFTVRKSA